MKKLLIPLLLMLMALPLRAAEKELLFARILPDRSTLYAVQTPQCFDRAAYLDRKSVV